MIGPGGLASTSPEEWKGGPVPATRYTSSYQLTGDDPANDVHSWLSATLTEWHLPAGLGRRWLAGAGEHLGPSGADELYLQFDAVMGLVTVELWQEGRVLFGIDDWVGSGSELL